MAGGGLRRAVGWSGERWERLRFWEDEDEDEDEDSDRQEENYEAKKEGEKK